MLLLAFALLLGSGGAALLAARSPRWSSRLGAGGTVGACVLGLVPTVAVLLGGSVPAVRAEWPVPYGSFALEVDALSAFFLLPLFLLSPIAAVYGSEYLQAYGERKLLGPSWFFFNVLVASMAVVMTARNAVLFLMAWEIMTLASFFLVTFEDERESVRRAGWIYLVAMHLGTACVLALFVAFGRGSATLDFADFRVPAANAGILFGLALVGFGTKAGFLPLHVWLPEAHPAAPSHVSALMSGVMIKTGIYGLVRALTFLGSPPASWGWVLCAVGVTSGVGGVLFALAQHDLKRLLAYHSVENIGIIALGLGVGMLGLSSGSSSLAVLGFAGAFLHVLNHAIFKGLLFLGAGAVTHATGTREIDDLGGLLKAMPWTGVTFLVGAVAISGLPPLNGFVSEFLIYLGAFHGVASGDRSTVVPLLCVIGGLALIGGLATACFTKAFGIVFLGEPRGPHALHAHECAPAMRIPMLMLAASCVAIGVGAPFVMRLLSPVLADVLRLPLADVSEHMTVASGPLSLVAVTFLGLMVLVGLGSVLRRKLLSGRAVTEAVTWDCGYARPTARMQYTASSFAQPLTDFFNPLLQTRRHLVAPRGLFPRGALFATETLDVWNERVYAPLFASIESGLARLRWLQHGRVHLYVLYIALTLLALLVWKLG